MPTEPMDLTQENLAKVVNELSGSRVSLHPAEAYVPMPIEGIIDEAFGSALLYGIGLVAFTYEGGRLVTRCVPRDEFITLGEHLKSVTENSVTIEENT